MQLSLTDYGMKVFYFYFNFMLSYIKRSDDVSCLLRLLSKHIISSIGTNANYNFAN